MAGAPAVGGLSTLDAVTVDANGTLVRLLDPIARLDRALRVRGVERTRAEIAQAFAAEAAYYAPRSHRGRDENSLTELRRDCARVFLEALGVKLDASEFAPDYVGALEFELIPEAKEALERVAATGLRLAVVANWDMTLPETLRRLGVDHLFVSVVTSAEAGAAKPDPAIFRLALERLGVPAARALHVGDDPVDQDGARAAGMHFAPAPLADALQALRYPG